MESGRGMILEWFLDPLATHVLDLPRLMCTTQESD